MTAVLCTVDMNSRNGTEGANRKVKGTLHWVSATENIPFEARLYEPLMMDEDEAEAAAEAREEAQEDVQEEAVASSTLKLDFLKKLNPNSLEVCHGCMETYLGDAEPGATYQFLRLGYFCKDTDSTPEHAVFNRVVGLKDAFAKQIKG